MDLHDFLSLVPIFKIPRTPDKGYRLMIPLADIIDVFEKNNLGICEKSIPPKNMSAYTENTMVIKRA